MNPVPKEKKRTGGLDSKKSLITHLEELRLRILYCLGLVLAATALSFIYRDPIFDLLRSPISRELVFISPHEAFFVLLKASLISGIVISSPFTAYHIWKFIGIALKKNEKAFLFKYIPLSLLLFSSGLFFGFKVVLPAGLDFLLGFGGTGLTPMITVSKYMSFVFLVLMVFSVTFQLPLVMRLVTALGVVRRTALASGRRHAVVVIFIVSALLTPPDVFTQLALALPIILLYEIGLVFSKKDDKVLG